MIGLCDDIVMDDFNPETNAVLMELNRSISRQDDCETRAPAAVGACVLDAVPLSAKRRSLFT
jgi:hypothetical protein